MRSSPKETVTAAIPIHRVHPSSFWKGMILAAIVLVSSSQVSAGDKAPCDAPVLGYTRDSEPRRLHKPAEIAVGDWPVRNLCRPSQINCQELL